MFMPDLYPLGSTRCLNLFINIARREREEHLLWQARGKPIAVVFSETHYHDYEQFKAGVTHVRALKKLVNGRAVLQTAHQ